MSNALAPPCLIALDWGTSNLRASLLGPRGAVLETRAAPGGVMAVPERGFEAALMALVGDWCSDYRVPLVASGMVGSRQGWRETPYLDCPATLLDAAAQLTRVELAGGAVLHIAPGLRCRDSHGHFDVMRGEETQLWGAGLAAGGWCLLPGTHAKWAWLGEGGRIERFATYMTGELYGVLTQHSILGRLMQFGEVRPLAFEQGVRRGLAGFAEATHALFAARTAGLMGQQEAEALPDYLSGILIGVEIGSATRTRTATEGPPVAAMARRAEDRAGVRAVTLLGDAALVQRYSIALGIAGIRAATAPADATTRGQWRLAEAAGLLAGAGASGQA